MKQKLLYLSGKRINLKLSYFLSLIVIFAILASCSNPTTGIDQSPVGGVTLVSPKDKAEVSTTPMLLKWKSLQEMNKYRVQVAQGNSFSALVVNEILAKSSYRTSGLLLNGQTYYWRVQAINDGRNKNWSSIYRFTVKAKNNPDISNQEVLMDLYQATGGDQWTNNSGWGSNNPLETWYGINTNAEGKVTRIDLWHNNLTGKIEDIAWGGLDEVKYLNVKYNHLTGQIPPSIGGMESLRVLILQGRTYGDYPGEFNEPRSLDSGDWTTGYHQGKHYSNTNDFHGQIPATFGNLSNLIVLEISNAPHVVGPIPPELGNLTNLKGLYLTGANFSGTEIPETLCNLTKLKHLYLGEAGLVGEIPRCFSNLTELTHLFIPGTESAPFPVDGSLTGTIPDLSQLKDLVRLVLSDNKLTGQFPQYFNNGNFTQLETLVLSWNDLTGTLPHFDNLPSLYNFKVSGNEMTGSIETLTELPAHARIIGVGWNNFSGDFPHGGWPDFYRLKSIRVNTNDLTGSIPCSFWKKLDNPTLNVAWFDNNPYENVCRSAAKAMEGNGSINLEIDE